MARPASIRFSALWLAAAVSPSLFSAPPPAFLQAARDRQDRAGLQRIVDESAAAAAKAPQDADTQYQMALASSYLAEVALEVGDKKLAQQTAERGVKAAEQAVALQPREAEYYRVLGTLCGQIVPANVLAGLGYAKRARDAIDKAVSLDPKSSMAYMARGVGNYYVPSALGGGFDLAVADFRKALELDSKNADAWLWLGMALRKQNKNADARQAFSKSLELNPGRNWTRQQLEKTATTP
ncbi:MAG TPA: tetratricopeptide repeat protein [Bryobacteraceae bacterium]|nr:tetratricopeptide repeat protein [Bryobacteraceae bacterium]